MYLADMGAEILRVISGLHPDAVDFLPPLVPGTNLSAARPISAGIKRSYEVLYA